MSNEQLDFFDGLRWSAYLAAMLLVVTPLADVLLTVRPVRLTDVEWRFGSVGLLSGSLLLPLVGALLASVTAVWLRQFWVLRLLSWACLLGALVLFLAVSSFGLDMIQIRGTVPPEALTSFDSSGARALFRTSTAAVAFAVLGLESWRALPELEDALPPPPPSPS